MDLIGFDCTHRNIRIFFLNILLGHWFGRRQRLIMSLRILQRSKMVIVVNVWINSLRAWKLIIKIKIQMKCLPEECPWKVCSTVPLSMSQSATVASPEPVKIWTKSLSIPDHKILSEIEIKCLFLYESKVSRKRVWSLITKKCDQGQAPFLIMRTKR